MGMSARTGYKKTKKIGGANYHCASICCILYIYLTFFLLHMIMFCNNYPNGSQQNVHARNLENTFKES